jgi:hypothetical protein
LSPVRVDRQDTFEPDPLATFHEWTAFTRLAEAELFEPREQHDAETVVELGYVDVGWAEVSSGPELPGRISGSAC